MAMNRIIIFRSSILFLYTISGKMAASTASPKSEVISVGELSQLMKGGKVKLVDAAYVLGQKPDWREYKKDYYGQFDKSIANLVQAPYLQEHVPGAVNFNLDIAMYPGEFQRFALYQPELFEQYVRRLGINNDDHVVVIGRGPFGGMLFAAKVWWLLKYYGHRNVQVLNGGLESWKRAGYPVDNRPVPVQAGNFKATVNSKKLLTFEDMERIGSDGKALIDKLATINAYDARPPTDFDGSTPPAFPSSGPMPGFHLQGAKNLPAKDLVNEHGLKPTNELWNEINKAGYDPSKKTLTYCAVGIQASLTQLALSSAGVRGVQQFHGGLTETAVRDPSKISGR